MPAFAALQRGSLAAPGSRAKAGGRKRTCTSKAHRLSICGICYSRLTTRPKNTQNGASHRCCPGTTFLQRNSAALLQGGEKWLAKPKLGRRRLVAVPSAALGTAG